MMLKTDVIAFNKGHELGAALGVQAFDETADLANVVLTSTTRLITRRTHEGNRTNRSNAEDRAALCSLHVGDYFLQVGSRAYFVIQQLAPYMQA